MSGCRACPRGLPSLLRKVLGRLVSCGQLVLFELVEYEGEFHLHEVLAPENKQNNRRRRTRNEDQRIRGDKAFGNGRKGAAATVDGPLAYGERCGPEHGKLHRQVGSGHPDVRRVSNGRRRRRLEARYRKVGEQTRHAEAGAPGEGDEEGHPQELGKTVTVTEQEK